MLQLPEELVEQVRAYTEEIIDERDLWYGEDGQDSTYGIETDPHITILYGYSTNSIPKISQSFEEYPKDYVDFKLGAINYFKHKGYFVLHIEVVSQDLQKLHNLTIKSGLKIYNFFPKYKPHVTLAYLKSNKIKRYEDYVGDEYFGDETWTSTKIKITTADGKAETFSLEKS